MDQKMVEVYDSLLTLEGMLTEAISECAEAAQKAHNAGLDEIANRLGQGILPQIHVFLDSTEPHSMQALLEIADGVPPTSRVQETRAIEQPSQEPVEYSHSGNPKYDEMFNNLLESSRQTKHTFKLDQAPDPEEIEQTEHPLLSERDKNAPRQPMERRKEEVAFDGMENWRSMINESSSSGPSGDAGDIVNTLMNIDEGSLDMGGAAPSPNPPQTGNNDGIEVDPSIAGALAGM